jgi:hypothetical protein
MKKPQLPFKEEERACAPITAHSRNRADKSTTRLVLRTAVGMAVAALTAVMCVHLSAMHERGRQIESPRDQRATAGNSVPCELPWVRKMSKGRIVDVKRVDHQPEGGLGHAESGEFSRQHQEFTGRDGRASSLQVSMRLLSDNRIRARIAIDGKVRADGEYELRCERIDDESDRGTRNNGIHAFVDDLHVHWWPKSDDRLKFKLPDVDGHIEFDDNT